MYLQSKNVTVFPVAKNRSSEVNGGRLFTEDYVANIVRQLIDTTGFIIECNPSSGIEVTNTLNVRFNLYGYYFDVTFTPQELITAFESDPNNKWGNNLYVIASILLDDTTREIVGQDVNDATLGKIYQGLDISISTEATKNSRSLKLFSIIKNKDGTYKLEVYDKGFQKFEASAIYITEIDGKH